jgi:hypothetical protein
VELTWSNASAWREILERVFEGFEYRENVSPAWMTNPYTGRRLKLDRYYPDLGIAFRLVGMTGRQNRQISDQEIEQERERNHIRDRLCRQKGVTLVQLDVNETEPWRLVDRIRSALNRTSRLLAQSGVDLRMKRDLAPRLARASQVCESIRSQVRQEDGLKLYADLWQDRQYAPAPDAPASKRSGRRRRYAVGMIVDHATFGAGEVVALSDAAEDATVVVRFDDGMERTFLVDLVGDKLLPA